jgi:hypothetical protein
MWQDTAKHLGMETASPISLALARHMNEKVELWREIAERHNLIQLDPGQAGRLGGGRESSIPKRSSFGHK